MLGDALVGGVYVFTIKFQLKTSNPVVNGVADKAVRSFGGWGVYFQLENNISNGICSCEDVNVKNLTNFTYESE